MKTGYRHLSQAYDLIMNGGLWPTYKKLLQKNLNTRVIKGRRILDLGCGTGTILSRLSENNETFGIDQSTEMIKIARKKDLNSHYQVGDIAKFRFAKKFDVIICTYDTINHLLKFNQWEKIFLRVANSLEKDGVFIFDFNTETKLQKIDGSRLAKRANGLIVSMYVKCSKSRCQWHIDINIRQGKRWTHRFERIDEISFPTKKVKNALSKRFSIIQIIEKNGRAFVAAKK